SPVLFNDGKENLCPRRVANLPVCFILAINLVKVFLDDKLENPIGFTMRSVLIIANGLLKSDSISCGSLDTVVPPTVLTLNLNGAIPAPSFSTLLRLSGFPTYFQMWADSS